MKMFQLNILVGKYQELVDCGNLRPFADASLLEQIMNAFGKALELATNNEDQSKSLVFSGEEEKQILTLSDQVVGNLQINRGLGHTTHSVSLLLTPLLRPEGLLVEYIPADGDANRPITEVSKWSLAISRR